MVISNDKIQCPSERHVLKFCSAKGGSLNKSTNGVILKGELGNPFTVFTIPSFKEQIFVGSPNGVGGTCETTLYKNVRAKSINMY